MSWFGKLIEGMTRRVPRLAMATRRHPWRAGGIVLAVVIVIVAAILFVPPLFQRCGPGLVSHADGTECVGVDLASGPMAPHEPPEMAALEADVAAVDDISGAGAQDYIGIVLLMNMSPVAGVDTRAYPDVYPDVEGAITAVWRANHTAAVQGSLPKVKLLLGNMGTQYAGWSIAVDQIKAAAPANHITAVIGLGQSVAATQAAAAKIVTDARLPVIGATVTGDSMNFYPGSTNRNNGFFRVSPTNKDTVTAAANYIAGIEPDPTRVAIVQDNAPGDDYNQTLAKSADADMPSAHVFPFTSPTSLPPGVQRNQELKQQFSFLDENICSVRPGVIYFAGRGADMGAFVETWTQTGTPCQNSQVTVVTGDDGGKSISDPEMGQALRARHVTVMFTSEASPDEWGACPKSGGGDLKTTEQADYDTFQAAFTGRPDVCTKQHVVADDGALPLSFKQADLTSEEAAGAHDAAVVAITAARRTDLDADSGDGGIVVRDPYSQVGLIEEMRCTNAVHGASGLIQFSQNASDYGNPVNKPVPIAQIYADGTTRTLFLANSGGGVPVSSC